MIEFRFTWQGKTYSLAIGHQSQWGTAQLDLVSFIREDYENGDLVFAKWLWNSPKLFRKYQ